MTWTQIQNPATLVTTPFLGFSFLYLLKVFFFPLHLKAAWNIESYLFTEQKAVKLVEHPHPDLLLALFKKKKKKNKPLSVWVNQLRAHILFT